MSSTERRECFEEAMLGAVAALTAYVEDLDAGDEDMTLVQATVDRILADEGSSPWLTVGAVTLAGELLRALAAERDEDPRAILQAFAISVAAE